MNPREFKVWYDYSPHWKKDNVATAKVEKDKQRKSGPSEAKRKQIRKKR